MTPEAFWHIFRGGVRARSGRQQRDQKPADVRVSTARCSPALGMERLSETSRGWVAWAPHADARADAGPPARLVPGCFRATAAGGVPCSSSGPGPGPWRLVPAGPPPQVLGLALESLGGPVASGVPEPLSANFALLCCCGPHRQANPRSSLVRSPASCRLRPWSRPLHSTTPGSSTWRRQPSLGLRVTILFWQRCFLHRELPLWLIHSTYILAVDNRKQTQLPSLGFPETLYLVNTHATRRILPLPRVRGFGSPGER